MKNFKFSNVNSDDLEDYTMSIERIFAIQFKDDDELYNVHTIGEFCEVIKSKMINNDPGCTSQQAFYKLKNAVRTVTNKEINPNTLLSDIFPVQNRIKTVKAIEKQIGFTTNILKAKGWVIVSLLLLLIIGIITLFFNLSWGIAISLTSVLSLVIAGKTGKELAFETVGDLVNDMKTNNYSKSRRNSETCNHNEIEDIVVTMLADTTGYTKKELADMIVN